ncbi:hypothetical protein HMPREF1863_00960 [Aedoeadaptatus coxii]|uniref:Lipoprotein n=1 Tax=Aedoeadaptatus coxii TaxID=755172 RepID=A0A134AG73_9FIRM|nr:hypothetical protein [Peptoniphilus coxii]KXB66717.1 hypothetical protein HMPREF1863_00960 [Peptoniphilus coxii]
MKWFKLIPVLALAVALIGCGKGDKSASINGNADSTMMAAQKNKNSADNNDGEYDPVGDREREEAKLFESDNSKTRYAALEDASDYISLVELSSDAGGGVSLKFIKNYKGALSTIELKTPKSLTPNQEYIVFYRDTPEGDVRPTHDTYAFYKVDGSDDELLRYFEKKYDERYSAKDEKTSKSSKDKDKDTAEAGSASTYDSTDKDAADTTKSSKESTKSGESSSKSKSKSKSTSKTSKDSDEKSSTSKSTTSTKSTKSGTSTKSTKSTKGSSSKKQSTKRSTNLEN